MVKIERNDGDGEESRWVKIRRRVRNRFRRLGITDLGGEDEAE